MTEKVQQLKEMIQESSRIVFFGGAGVSTESGIPDFRSAWGVYHQQSAIPPETIVSHDFFFQHTQEFYDFYKSKMLFPDAKPNPAHLALAALEKQGKLTAVITQNIDCLHEMAGSKNVLKLHGTCDKNICLSCGKIWPLSRVLDAPGIPLCDCGGTLKPDVVLYGEGLDNQVIQKAVLAISQADLLIIGGTSLVVYPAAGLIDYFRGSKLVLINKSATSADRRADLLIPESIGQVLEEAVLQEP